MPGTIPGLKLIKHNASNVNLPDDPSYPYKLEANFRPPEFMQVAFVFMHGGSEEIIVRGMTVEALNRFIDENNLRHHRFMQVLNAASSHSKKLAISPNATWSLAI
jgi:hypothetical protein